MPIKRAIFVPCKPSQYNEWLDEGRWDKCERCALHETRLSIISGEGPMDASVVFVGEAPGGTEEIKERPFVGTSGKLLNEIFYTFDLERENYRLTTVVMCRPPDFDRPSRNRKPVSEETKACKERLYEEIYTIDPVLIIALGGVASAALGGPSAIEKNRGRFHEAKVPSRIRGKLVYPMMVTWHPSYVLRNMDRRGDGPMINHLRDVIYPTEPYFELASDILRATIAASYIESLHAEGLLEDSIFEYLSMKI